MRKDKQMADRKKWPCVKESFMEH